MPVYNGRDRVQGGVPLGGIGAGKFELLPNGLLNAFTFQNNWSHPVSGNGEYPGVLGFHFGVSVEFGRGKKLYKKSYLLQAAMIPGISTLKPVRYEGIFPKAKLYYKIPGLDAEVCLEAFSSWIPGDAKNSSLPTAFFKWHVHNRSGVPLKAGLIFIARNTSGEWCVGRQNKVHEDGRSLHLELLNHDPTSYDGRRGRLRFSFPKGAWKLSFIESWNAVTKNFSFTPKDIALPAWDEFVRNGKLSDRRSGAVASGENHELCGAVAASQPVPPKKKKKLLFTACWHFPHQAPWGHRYAHYFKDAAQVSRYASLNRKALESKVSRLHKHVFSLPFPRWFNDALLTGLSPFFASSWYTKDGRFSFYEAPEVCPLMGTLDVGFYGSIPLSYFFPELEYSSIRQFAKAQRPDGYIPHDLGRNRLDLPSDGTTFYFWKDLNPKFILMVYRDFLWSGRQDRLRSLYPHVRKALGWTLDADKDGDGLPDHEGADQTFDLWDLRGPHAYTSGIFLAALLACQRVASLLGDRKFFNQCRDAYLKGRTSFENKLWNGSYFGGTCSLSQLNGQWYADLLALGPIADLEKIRKAILYIRQMSGKHSRHGFVNSVLRDGRPDTSNPHAQNVWIGMNWAFLSLCVSRGFSLNHVLKDAYRVWDNIRNIQKSPWNQPDMVDAKTGRYLFGDFYYRNMAIWSIPIAYAMKNKKTALLLQKIRSLGASKP
ncbi:MAG: hypothetical protein A3C47_01940 [Omnitrophica bacterium RIFCSPHIGHO2_02_FULL_51_18]|nr:MAG: hypothetical protein A3C47_01940 [Omnitrophica bacterium RIFCSPHIGHO2_02_FULL_51_18]